MSQNLENVKAILLAAGKGVRMKSERAKVLHEILGRPILAYGLRALREAGVSEILVVVGHQAEEVKKAAGTEVRFVHQKEQKGTGHAALACEAELGGFEGDLLVLPGDAPLIRARTLKAILEIHRKDRADAMFLSACLDDPTGYGRVIRAKDGKFQKVVEESDATPQEKGVAECNSGIYAFRSKALFAALKKVDADNAKGEYYLTDVLKHIGKVNVMKTSESTEIYGINSRRDLVACTNYLRWKILERHMDGGVSIVDPSTTFIEDGVEIGADSTIFPYTVIRRDVKIGRNCEVGPFSHVRPGTVLEDGVEIGNFVEVKNSKVGTRSKAKHLSYLGDATLGANVNIGAGTITANYDGKKKNPTIIEDDAQTGSNTVLVAPVKLGKGSKTGAGAVVPKGEVPPGAVVVGVPARPLGRTHA